MWQWHGQGGAWAVAALSLLFALGFAVLAVWAALPFAVFGVKRLLRELLAAERDTGRQLEELRRAVARLADREPPGDGPV